MEYHYFTIEDVEMLKFNGITHLHNHLNYLIHTDKDQNLQMKILCEMYPLYLIIKGIQKR